MFIRPGTQPNALLILANIKPDKMQTLQSRLDTIRALLTNNQRIYFHNTRTVHFAAWMILPGVKGENGRPDGPARLALETDYDGSIEDHLKDLVTNCRQALDEVYDCCESYPAAGARTEESIRGYLYERYMLTERNPSAHYVAFTGRTVEDIRNAISVYKEAKAFFETLDKRSSPNKIRCDLVAHFKLAPAVSPRRFPITQTGLLRLFVLNLVIGIPFMVLYGLLFALPLCLIARLFEEKEQCDEQKRPLFDPTYHAPEYKLLDLGKQNHLCTFATVRPGAFRMFVAKSALWLGTFLFAKFFILGKLDQMTTVYFARWMLVDRQLLFYGNYDGDYSSYLSDFSDQAWGVNLIWGNTIGFPPTRFLARGGASDLEGFQTQALTHYSPAPVFYAAYGNYSVPNILRYLELRDELAEAIDPSLWSEVKNWCRKW